MLNYSQPTGYTPPPTYGPSPPEPPPFAWLPQGFAFLRRNLMTMLVCAGLGSAAGVAYVATATSQYTASATLVIDSRRSHPVRTQPISFDAQSENVFVESQVEVLRQQGMLRAVVEALSLDHDPRFVGDPSAPPGFVAQLRRRAAALLRGGSDADALDPAADAKATAADALSRMLEVRRVGLTAVVEINVTSPTRQLSAQIANAVSQVYIERQLSGNADVTRRAGSWLQERIAELREYAITADRTVQEYKAANNIVEMGGVTLSEQELTELAQIVATARGRVAETAARVDRLETTTPGSVIRGSVAEALQNPVINRLRQQFLDASRREAELAARHGPSHGAVTNLRSEMAELERAIQNELARIAEVHRSELSVAEANLRGVEAHLANQMAAAARLNIERSVLRSLQSTADANKAIFENFLQRYSQAMQDQSYPISDARILTQALPPQQRSRPRGMIIIAGALAVGLFLGVGISVLREALDNKVRTPTELLKASGAGRVWVLRETPELRLAFGWRWSEAARGFARTGRFQLPESFRHAVTEPSSSMAEAVQGVRGAMARVAARGSAIRVLGVSSVEGRAGVTTFAANLAVACAVSGKRVALIDWMATLPVESRADTNNDTLKPAMQTVKDAATGLHFVAICYRSGAGMAERWQQTCQTLAELQGDYDLIILDLPPMAEQGSAIAMHDLLDGFVLVTRWGHTPADRITEVMARTASLDTLFMGAILNRANLRRMRLEGGGWQGEHGVRPATAELSTV